MQSDPGAQAADPPEAEPPVPQIVASERKPPPLPARKARRTDAEGALHRSLWRRALALVYPSQCLMCRSLVESDFALCPSCWRDTPFLMGLVCNGCGAPLPGDDASDDVLCDECIAHPRPWSRGRAAVLHDGNGRRIVLALKYHDRDDLAAPAAAWMARAAAPLITPSTLLVPVPLHWWRLFRRRFNQAAMLAQALAPLIDRPCAPDALIRPRATATLARQTRDERFATLNGAIRPHPRRGQAMAGRNVLLIDDVLTSGATLDACTRAAYAAGAADVRVLTLARAAKAP